MVEEFLFEQQSRHFAQPQTFRMDHLLHEVHQLEHPVSTLGIFVCWRLLV